MAIPAIGAALKAAGGKVAGKVLAKAATTKLGSKAGLVGTSVGTGVRKGSTIDKVMGAYKKKGDSDSKKSSSSSSESSDSSYTPETVSSPELHPMAQRAMNLDMGFYGHMHPKSIKKSPCIKGGINASKKGRK